jgi:hypothetical protein
MATKQTRKNSKVTYSVHPAVAYLQAVIENLPKKTGRSLAEWQALVTKHGPAGEKERVAWLKKEHALGSTTAGIIADRAAGIGWENGDAKAYLKAAGRYVDEMYAEGKLALRPLHDTLIDLALSLGSDVKICPCTTIVPIYRKHVFAQIKPSTRTRIDLGLALNGGKQKIPKRVVDTGGLKKGDRITHRIPLSSVAEIDAEVKEWLKIAYDLDK